MKPRDLFWARLAFSYAVLYAFVSAAGLISAGLVESTPPEVQEFFSQRSFVDDLLLVLSLVALLAGTFALLGNRQWAPTMLIAAAAFTTVSAALDVFVRRGYELLGNTALVGIVYVAIAWIIAIWAMIRRR